MYFLMSLEKKNKPGASFQPTRQPYQGVEKPQMYVYRDTVVKSMHLGARQI